MASGYFHSGAKFQRKLLAARVDKKVLISFYFVNSFLMFLKHLKFVEFPIAVNVCLFDPYMFAHTGTVSYSNVG